MSMTPSEVGARAELEVACALERCGWRVYLPAFASHERIDLVTLRSTEMLRVQVKSARVIGTAVQFRVCSNTRNVPRDYRGEVDAFGVYAAQLDRVFLVPVPESATRLCTLRLVPARSGQRKGIRMAGDYEIRPPG